MNETTTPNTITAEAGRVDPVVRPLAWAAFTPNGNIRIWTSAPDDVRKLAEQAGMELTPLYDLKTAPVAIMDTRAALGLCAIAEEDFPALYALQGHRVALIDMGPNASHNRTVEAAHDCQQMHDK